MGSYAIGLSGLRVAQQMIDLTSTNIANATTEGYHRQEAIISPVILNTYSGVGIGGAEISAVRRNINSLLEVEIANQQGVLSQTSEELDVLRAIEAAFGEVGSGGLSDAIDNFFNSLTELAGDPNNEAMRVQAVWAGDALAGEFRNLGTFLQVMDTQIRDQTEEGVREFNSLTAKINDLTDEMAVIELRGGSNNILRDQRDQAVMELSKLADVRVAGMDDAQVESLRVSAWGIPVVTRTSSIEIESYIDNDGDLSVGVLDSGVYQSGARGGKIGAMLAVKNDILSDLRTNLDALANEVITAVNDIHIQGVGSNGSFSELTGITVDSGAFSGWSAPITDGSFYVRVTDTSTNAVTRTKVDVATTDTVSDISTLIDGITGVSTSIGNSALTIAADAGYKFDFMPAVLPTPTSSTIAGTSVPTISGLYSGTTNQTYTCTVVGTGDVGVATSLSLEVRDGSNQLMRTMNIGQGYAAGDLLEIDSGIDVALTSGGFVNGDVFTVQALADSDTSGFLGAAGINSLFSGTSAANMAVRSDILDDPTGRFACSIGAAMTDSVNVDHMINIGDVTRSALSDKSVQDYYRNIVVGVGQSVSIREAKKIGLDNVVTQLESQRENISGVDINEEAAKLISLERMYQGMARVIAAQDKALGVLMDLL
ncbi:MAG: flagellar hook-associated protein FlgK [bacterium]|nr:flagellar hook-associated protein FlgK [bacterium]